MLIVEFGNIVACEFCRNQFAFSSKTPLFPSKATAALSKSHTMPAIEHKLNITEEEIPDNVRLIAQDQGECPKTKQETIEEFRKYILGEFRLKFLNTPT